jgi:hypothetical protein
VYNELGYGFLESAYAGAMEIVLGEHSLEARRQPPLDVHLMSPSRSDAD